VRHSPSMPVRDGCRASPSSQPVSVLLADVVRLLRSAALIALTCSCHPKQKGPEPAPRPVEVGVVVLRAESVLLTTELPGRTSAYETSEVRPQVSGIVRARTFTEGQVVKQGQTLYQIDARPYRAAEAQARANLVSAQAATGAARARAERYESLVQIQAVSEQDYADAKASAEQAVAAVEQARAALQTASINLQYTTVAAPIAGRIGRSLVTTGALVTANQAQPLATIQRLDPIFVDLQQSTADLLALRRSLSEGGALAASADVTLVLEDGSNYSRNGKVQFAEATVDPSTSAVTLRARFDNPDGVLLPGMYVRALVTQAQRPSAILAPQPGVTRDPKGNATALVVGPDDKVVLRQIRTSRVVRDMWLVDEGLAAGDRLIVEGTVKVKPGQRVKPVPAGERAASSAAPQPSARP
ncbi:MAG TPA: efflux RND transporter periplasmic adaptor subunit, partial [Polyangiaceae bacterium]|nr:efflux RND transporter periplasmic adaptor subunit [Polyangiaceae bacterium]